MYSPIATKELLLCKTEDQTLTQGNAAARGTADNKQRLLPTGDSESKFKKSPMIPEMKGHSSLKWSIWLCNGAQPHEMGINCPEKNKDPQCRKPLSLQFT